MVIRVLTYNIHKGIGTDGKFNLDRTIQLLSDANADIYCLQEVDLHVPRSGNQDLAHTIASSLDMDFRMETNVRLKNGSYGNATISRFPFVKAQNLDITWRIKKKRGCLITQLELPKNKMFFIYNIHLGLAAFERSWQIHKLLTSPIHKENVNYPILIAGDTNDSRHRLNQLMEVGGYYDACQTRMKRSNFTFPAYAPVIRIDKIFYSKQWQIKGHHVMNSKLARTSSDHRPFHADFELQPG